MSENDVQAVMKMIIWTIVSNFKISSAGKSSQCVFTNVCINSIYVYSFEFPVECSTNYTILSEKLK